MGLNNLDDEDFEFSSFKLRIKNDICFRCDDKCIILTIKENEKQFTIAKN